MYHFLLSYLTLENSVTLKIKLLKLTIVFQNF